MVDYFFPNGCPICGGKVDFVKASFIYKCQSCGAFACVHRKSTINSQKYTPYQDMASSAVHKLRNSLSKEFNNLWMSRTDVRRDNSNEIIDEALINIIYTDNIRIYQADEPKYVKIISPHHEDDTCDIVILDTFDVVPNVEYGKLLNVKNRDKAKVWLALQLGVNVNEFNIGFLNENQIKTGLSLCLKHMNDARRRAIESIQNRT